MQKKNIKYMWFDVTLYEDSAYYYIDFNLGFGINKFPKDKCTLEDALNTHAQIYNSNNY